MGIITFDGVESTELNIVVSRPPDFDYPEREYEVVKVPGRSGDLIKDLNSFSNVKREYDVALADRSKCGNFNEMVTKLMAWLHPGKGYKRLYDTYDREHYRMAYYSSSGSITNLYNEVGACTLKFECKPQRFLFDGDIPIEVPYTVEYGTTWSAAVGIQNRTNFISKPLFKVYGTGSVTISFNKGTDISTEQFLSVTLSNIVDTILFDMDTLECYKMNGSSKVYSPSSYKINSGEGLIPGYSFVRFQPGPSSSITKIEIIPRWWEL